MPALAETVATRVVPVAVAGPSLVTVTVSVTVLPSATGSVESVTATARSATVRYVYWEAALVALVPAVLLTVTSTVAGAWAGVVAVIWVSLTTVNEVAAVVPNFTEVTPVKPVPVIVTEVPPVLGPEVGLRPPTTGCSTSTTTIPRGAE